MRQRAREDVAVDRQLTDDQRILVEAAASPAVISQIPRTHTAQLTAVSEDFSPTSAEFSHQEPQQCGLTTAAGTGEGDPTAWLDLQGKRRQSNPGSPATLGLVEHEMGRVRQGRYFSIPTARPTFSMASKSVGLAGTYLVAPAWSSTFLWVGFAVSRLRNSFLNASLSSADTAVRAVQT